MKSSGVAVIAGLGIFVLFGAGWYVLSSPADQRVVEGQVAGHVEQARRHLSRYSHGLEQQSGLLENLAAHGVEIDLDELDSYAEDKRFVDRFQAEHEEGWAAFHPTNWESDPPRPATASYGNIARLIADGLRERDVILDENVDHLEKALREVNAALAITDGEASGRNSVEANRLKGIVLYHLGLAEAVRAELVRAEEEPLRERLVELAATLRRHQLEIAQADAVELGVEIDRLRQVVQEREQKLAQKRQDLSSLDRRISEMETRLADARARAENARRGMDELRQQGINFANSQGASQFEEQFTRLDRTYRDAEREAQAVEFGNLANATIQNGDDYLEGEYVGTEGAEPQVTRGLQHVRGDREVSQVEVTKLEEEIAGLGDDIQRLEGIRDARGAVRRRAQTGIEQARSEAARELERLLDVQDAAAEYEDRALEYLADSASASNAASRLVSDWVREGQSQSQGLSAEARPASPFTIRSEDAWRAGYVAAQAADAQLQSGWLLYRRSSSEAETADVLAETADLLALREASPDELRSAATAAREQAVEAVEAAMATLERAHRDARRHWTLVAQQAGANLLLSLLLDRPEYRGDAVEALRSATKGRENEAYSQTYLRALEQLAP